MKSEAAPVAQAAAVAIMEAPVAVAEAALGESSPVAANSVAAMVDAPVHEANPLQEFGGRYSYEAAPADAMPARPRFAELAEAPSYAPLPRDYADERPAHAGEETRTAHAALSHFGEPAETEHPDLDIPAFLRRPQF
jgi:cell division protein FtsZ